jgi:hypothetical protein
LWCKKWQHGKKDSITYCFKYFIKPIINIFQKDQNRIVGGQNADPLEWPWIAVLFNGDRQFCGGSLIDDIHILSAGNFNEFIMNRIKIISNI